MDEKTTLFDAKRERERERERETIKMADTSMDCYSEYSENENSPHVAVAKVRETARCALFLALRARRCINVGGNLVLFFLPPPRRERCVVKFARFFSYRAREASRDAHHSSFLSSYLRVFSFSDLVFAVDGCGVLRYVFIETDNAEFFSPHSK